MGFHEVVVVVVVVVEGVVDVESEVENDDDDDDDGKGEKPLHRFRFAKKPTQQDRKNRYDIRFVDIIVFVILYCNLPVPIYWFVYCQLS